MMNVAMFRSLLLLSFISSVVSLAPRKAPSNVVVNDVQKVIGGGVVSRRKAFSTGAASIATVAATGISTLTMEPQPSWGMMKFSSEELSKGPAERVELLKLIAGDMSSDSELEVAIASLEKLDPSSGKAATSEQLGGTWELISSVNAAAFSPLLNLPQPIRPTSLQLVGADAEPVVGAGRIAQVLNFPILPLSIILSSGTVPVPSDTSVLEIFPPFRLEARVGGIKTQIVDSGSDAGFRALNGRTEEAQAAGRNLYKQRYLETSGQKGDLRISEVIAGDPVLIGAVFIHRRI